MAKKRTLMFPTEKKVRKKKGMFTKRQQFAIANPFDENKMDPDKGYVRDIGQLTTILTLDVDTDAGEGQKQPEWRASVAIQWTLGPEHKGKTPLMPFVPLNMWNERGWELAMEACRGMLKGVGLEEKSYWTGEVTSINYRRPLTAEEMGILNQVLTLRGFNVSLEVKNGEVSNGD